MKLTIITVTKERSHSLIEQASRSLTKQDNHNFEWVVISDGLSNKTETAVKQFADSAPFKIKYHSINSYSGIVNDVIYADMLKPNLKKTTDWDNSIPIPKSWKKNREQKNPRTD